MALPSPASDAVHVVDELGADVLVTVQVGAPPYLKCGEAARAAEADTPMKNSVRRPTSIRRIFVAPLSFSLRR